MLPVICSGAKARRVTYDPERDYGEVDRLSYDPMHDYRRVDVDAWAEQWFSGIASLEPGSEGYDVAEQAMHRQMNLHPGHRESNGHDLKFGMWLLALMGSQNPHDPDSESIEDRFQHQQWEMSYQLARLAGRQIVRTVLEDAESYARFRVEQERSGTDYLTGVFNRRGAVRRLDEQYGITSDPIRRDPHGMPLPAVRLTHVYADANKFGWINKTLGQQVGDAAIIEAAWRAKDFFRLSESPIIYRHGGDEFGTILGGLGDYEIEQLTKRIMERQLDRVTSPEFKYQESMSAVLEAVAAVKASGRKIRAEARMRELKRDNIYQSERPYHTLYINGEPITELGDILSLSVGIASAAVSTLDGVEQLRRSAEAEMMRVKQTLNSIIEGKLIIRPGH